MKAKPIAFTLLALLLIGCNSAKSDNPVSSKKEDTGSETNTDKESETINEKDDLFKEVKTGLANFYKNDQSVTYSYTNNSFYSSGRKCRDTIVGTLDAINGLMYNKIESFEQKTSDAEETNLYSAMSYVGKSGDEYTGYAGLVGNLTAEKADKSFALYTYKTGFVDGYCKDVIHSYIEMADSFASVTEMVRYDASYYLSEYNADIVKDEEGIVLSFDLVSFGYYFDPYYRRNEQNYKIVVKDGFVSKLYSEYTTSDCYPNGDILTYGATISIDFKKGFNQTFYDSCTEISSAVDSNKGVSFTIPIYYEDYYYDEVDCEVGKQISEAYDAVTKFDGLYYDKEFTIPYQSRMPSTDVEKLYVKLKTGTDTSNALIYLLDEFTSISHDNIIPPSVDKTISVNTETELKEGSTTEVSYDLPWEWSFEEERNHILEKMYINGVETKEDSVDLTLGTVNTIRHTYTFFYE